MSLTIYHNPRCSKSRATLALIREAGIEPDIVAYLDDPPDAETVSRLARLLGMPVSGLLRRGETEFREASDLPEPGDEAGMAAWISRHPRVLERPIVVSADGSRAVLGRPPENVLEIVDR